MKKRKIIGVLMAAAMSVSLFSGFDSNVTVDQIEQYSTETIQNAQAFQVDMTLDMEMEISVTQGAQSQSLPFGVKGNLSLKGTQDPELLSLTGDLSMTQSGSPILAGSLEAYGEVQGTVLNLYYNLNTGNGGSWRMVTQDLGDAAGLSLVDLANGAISVLKDGVSVNPGSFNGRDCYEIAKTLQLTELLNDPNVMQSFMDAFAQQGITNMDENTLKTYLQMIFGGINVNIQQYFADDGTYAPVALHVDLNGSDWSGFGALVGQLVAQQAGGVDTSSLAINLDIPVCDFTMTYDYASPVSITIPDTAVTEGQANGPQDLNSFLGSLTNLM